MIYYTHNICLKRNIVIQVQQQEEWHVHTNVPLTVLIRRQSVSYEESFLFDFDIDTLLALLITAKQQWCDSVMDAQDHF